MQTDEQIYTEIQELENRHASVFELLAKLQSQHDLETRVEDQHRIEQLITPKQNTLNEIEQLIQTKNQRITQKYNAESSSIALTN